MWPVNLNIYYLLLISVLIMDWSVKEQVIKYSFYIVIILYTCDKCIYSSNISLKSFYTSYPIA